jgi:hypothetical protein
MKKLFLTLVLAFTGIFAANAQLWIGGSAGAAFVKNYSTFTIAPEIGYSFNNTPLSVAVEVDYAFAKYKDAKAEHELILKPYLRCNLATIEKFSVFMDLTGDFGVVNNKGYAISLRPGVAWMATEHWTAAFRFAFLQYDHGMYHSANGVYLDFKAVAPSFGLYYNF